MKMNLVAIMAAALASALIGNIVAAQNLEEVTVQVTRTLNTKTVGHNLMTGSPILDVSLSYGVRAGDLDLGSHYGPIQLEKRIHDAARAACAEIDRRYPSSTPSEDECAKSAADRAMVKVHELVAAAGNKSAK